jgi:hypothetical protein
MRISRIAVAAALLIAPTFLRAQDTPSEQDRQRSEMIKMKSDLRNLVTAQEAYYADHNAYAAEINGLKFRPNPGVTVTLVATQNNAWGAEARNEALPNIVCGIYVNLAEQYRPKVSVETKAAEGEPTCMDTSKAKGEW